MLLAGLQKNSFIDFPGKISCVLFVSGCNFICPYCHNAELARGDYPLRIPAGEAIGFLTARLGLLEGVTITGGEPTLTGGLVDLCETIKALGYPVKLDTNGSRPEMLRRLIEKDLVDFVAMDIKAPLAAYAPFTRQADIQVSLAESIDLIMQAAPAYEFRTTCVAPFIDGEAIRSIARAIEGAMAYTLQSFNRRATCLDPEFGRGQDPTIPCEAMEHLKTIADPFVNRCAIR